MTIHQIYDVKGVEVIVRREDMKYQSPLPPHGKMGILDMLCSQARDKGYKMIGCFGSKYSNWIVGVPYIAENYGLQSIICYPANDVLALPDWLNGVNESHIKLIRPNMVTINQAQAKKYVENRGGYFIPFGFDVPEVVNCLSRQFSDLPNEIGTIVLSCGSGITLASILRVVRLNSVGVERIEAISSGRAIKSIQATVRKHEFLNDKVRYRQPYEYAEVPNIQCPWNAHDHFELKAYDWLYKNVKRLPQPIYFINIGGNS
jgi:1-aminocyclopropane-1-carboxylate deaminase/D-cysteine desulfhydrase-like pyridoxal-dependent ACC family enzyme